MAAQDLPLLKRIEFLQALTDQQFQTLAEQLQTETFKRDAVVCRQGEPGSTLYIVKSGRLCVEAQSENGKKIPLAELQAGDFFGEFSLVTGDPRSATVTALEDSVLLSIGKPEMQALIDANPKLSGYISDVLAFRQYDLYRRMMFAGAVATPAVAESKPAAPSEPHSEVREAKKDLHKRITSYFSR